MKKTTRNEVGFAEIFRFAEEISGVDWNDANDLFFDESRIPYKRYRDFNREELKAELEYDRSSLVPPTKIDSEKVDFRGDSTLYFQIMYQYMLKHKVKEMRVFGD